MKLLREATTSRSSRPRVTIETVNGNMERMPASLVAFLSISGSYKALSVVDMKCKYGYITFELWDVLVM